MFAFQSLQSTGPVATAVLLKRVVIADEAERFLRTGGRVGSVRVSQVAYQYDIAEIHSETPYRLSDEIDINCQPFAAGASSLSMMRGDKGC
ncbi:hypothetical protein PSFL111601_23215 [Pseudomonas floridensis]